MAALALAFGTGATDAFAFLAFGGIFTANMTGNFILAGLFIRPHYLMTLIAGLLAIIVFAVAVAAAARYSAGAPTARRTSTLLLVCVAAQIIVLILWPLRPSTAGPLTLAAMSVSAAAMGVQTVAARTLTLPSAATTTFVTGTMVSLVSDLATGRIAGWQFRMTEVLLLPVGAVAGTFMLTWNAALGPVLPAVAAATGALLTLPRGRSTPAQAGTVRRARRRAVHQRDS